MVSTIHEPGRFPEPGPVEPDQGSASRLLRNATAAALVGAAIIHFAYAPHHLDENTSHGLFFLLMGWAQLGLAAAVARKAPLGRAVVAVGVLLNVGIIVVWVVSRTVGIGGAVEAVGFPDALCTVLEGFIALGLVAALGKGFSRLKLPEVTSGAFIGGSVVAVVALVTASMVPALGGGHSGHSHDATTTHGAAAGSVHDAGAHDVSAHDASAHDASAHDASAHDAPGQSHDSIDPAAAKFLAERRAAFLGGLPADVVAKRTEANRLWIADKIRTGSKLMTSLPEAEREQRIKTFTDWTVLHFTDEAHGGHTGNHTSGVAEWQWMPDPADRAKLEAQLKVSAAVIPQFPTAADAMKAGYFQATPWVAGIGAHYVNVRYLAGPFDPAHPSILLYGGNEPTSPIVGVSYAIYAGAAPEGFVGPNDNWHLHPALCMVGTMVVGADNTPKDLCESVGGSKGSGDDQGGLFMMHLWQVPGYESPWGLFSGENPNLNLATEDLPGV